MTYLDGDSGFVVLLVALWYWVTIFILNEHEQIYYDLGINRTVFVFSVRTLTMFRTLAFPPVVSLTGLHSNITTQGWASSLILRRCCSVGDGHCSSVLQLSVLMDNSLMVVSMWCCSSVGSSIWSQLRHSDTVRLFKGTVTDKLFNVSFHSFMNFTTNCLTSMFWLCTWYNLCATKWQITFD